MVVSVSIKEFLEKYGKVFIYAALLYFVVSLIIFAAHYVKISLPKTPLWILALVIGLLSYAAFKSDLEEYLAARSFKEALSVILLLGVAFGLFGVLTSVYAAFGMSMSVFGSVEVLNITAVVGKILPTFFNNFVMGLLVGLGMELASLLV
jgi:hypothetical protein